MSTNAFAISDTANRSLLSHTRIFEVRHSLTGVQKKSGLPTRRKGGNDQRRIVAVRCPELGEIIQ
jgi:hypothetical protein